MFNFPDYWCCLCINGNLNRRAKSFRVLWADGGKWQIPDLGFNPLSPARDVYFMRASDFGKEQFIANLIGKATNLQTSYLHQGLSLQTK